MSHQRERRSQLPAWRLAEPPDVSVPTLADITSRSRRAERRLRSHRWMAATVVLGFGLGGWGWHQRGNLQPASTSLAHGTTSGIAGPARDLETGPLPMGPAPSIRSDESKPPAPSESLEFRLLAKIHTDSPVYQKDRASGRLIPVGWVRQRTAIPVAMRPLSPRQLQTFREIWLAQSHGGML